MLLIALREHDMPSSQSPPAPRPSPALEPALARFYVTRCQCPNPTAPVPQSSESLSDPERDREALDDLTNRIEGQGSHVLCVKKFNLKIVIMTVIPTTTTTTTTTTMVVIMIMMMMMMMMMMMIMTTTTMTLTMASLTCHWSSRGCACGRRGCPCPCPARWPPSSAAASANGSPAAWCGQGSRTCEAPESQRRQNDD
jgi:hypothetical protein